MPERPSASRRILTATVSLATVGLFFAQAPAMADPVDDATKVAEGAATTPASSPPEVPSEPTSDDDSEGHETDDPTPPDHAGGSLVSVEILGEEILAVGETRSEIRDNGGARGHATLFRVGPFEFFRADSDSRGTQEETSGPVAPFCDPIGPILCFAAGQAHSESREQGSTSSSISSVRLLDLCLLPSGVLVAQQNGECGGVLVEFGAADSIIVRDRETGRTTALHLSELFNLCIGGVDSIEGCGTFLGAFAFADAPSDSALGEAFRLSCLGFIENGDVFCIEEEPGSLCLDSILCVFINQGETFLFIGGAAARQEAMHFAILPISEEVSLLDVHLVTAEVLARNFGVAEEEAPAAVEAPALAVTGADIWVLLLAAASLLGLGWMALATRRLVRGGATA